MTPIERAIEELNRKYLTTVNNLDFARKDKDGHSEVFFEGLRSGFRISLGIIRRIQKSTKGGSKK